MPDTRDSLEAEFGVMACRAQIRIWGLDDAAAQDAIAAGIAEARRIEYKYSRYRSDSIVSRINAAAGSGARIEVDEETAGLLDFAAQLHVQSEGRFDISSGVLRRVWNFREPRLPAAGEIAALLPLVGWQQVQWLRPHIALPRAGMELDFGGFGKEYAADRVATVLQDAGARGGYVNLGGDIRVLGPDAEGQPWRFGIQHPRRAEEVIAVLALAQGALATSGDYERYFEIDGRRYCHLLDPRSGWPVQDYQSISVLAPLCLVAGALSSIAMLSGAQAPAFLQSQHAAFLAVDQAGRLQHQGV
ncbi:thiamine biosynthesis lipoprotein [Solimonas aquatica]|uniref:FAD:protein FMN transferase n=1 Tax=Solimonas aquatica TaxID=489703 RepID=A0A1H9M4V5_9GAMM|nr:FAD:protein FMN transferase [Solimonas aquatica]SER18730.1 thiamine biosynthesis lipoprotein [Solimonas aquatica]